MDLVGQTPPNVPSTSSSASSPALLSGENAAPSNQPESPLAFPPSSTFSRRAAPARSESNAPDAANTPSLKFTFEAPEHTPTFEAALPTALPYPLTPRRPPMPSATMSPPEGLPISSPGAGPSSAAFKAPNGSAPESPSLATYTAPEELEAGSSSGIEYFDRPLVEDDDTEDDDEEDDDMDMEAEHDHYFREPTEEEEEADEGEMNTESEDEDDEVPELVRELEEEQGDEGEEEVNGHAGLQQDIVQLPDPNDDMEANLDDDMDGALEGE